MSKPKILLVDDRVENLIALETLLQDVGAELVRATSGNQALELTLDHEFALALIDVQMPEMDGFETVELMRHDLATALLPIIFVSAIYSDQFYQIKGMESGAVDFLVKPIIPPILLGKVNVFLRLYEQRRDLQNALEQVKMLQGLLPICSHCKDVRDDEGYWTEIESYICQHSDVDFSHSLCPTCFEKHYPDIHKRYQARKARGEIEKDQLDTD